MRKYGWIVGIAVLVGVLLLFMASTTAQEEEKKDKVLDEGEWLSLEGQLTKAGDRPAFKVTEGDHKGKTFILLENAKLEELEKWMKEKKPATVKISGEVTKYNNKNFLVISSFEKPGDDDEEEEEEGDK